MEKNAKTKVVLLSMLAALCLSACASASLVDQIIAPMTTAICRIYGLIKNVAGAIAALVITIAGFKWVGSSDDPGVRKAAKDNIIHALIGMLIIVIATDIVQLITASPGC
ncbi:MAG: TrbC/VirB2 family protein [Candidatus Altiarchaeota archaeon]|nr:TrbC/VirB2 family protein [Candidatus Altiarchaeota archaeon]